MPQLLFVTAVFWAGNFGSCQVFGWVGTPRAYPYRSSYLGNLDILFKIFIFALTNAIGAVATVFLLKLY